MSKTYTVEDVQQFKKPTESFLCPLSANTFGIDFLAFKIRDMDTAAVVFEVAKDPNAPVIDYPANFDYDQLRTISYKFPADFLRFKTVGTTLRFSVGNNAVSNFRMIERHYFKNKIIQSYDFNFPFCIPNSTNEWEAIYDMPKFTEKEIIEIIASPEETKSDSFYFVDGQLIMHNKATYTYAETSSSSKDQKSKSNTSSSSSSSSSSSTSSSREAKQQTKVTSQSTSSTSSSSSASSSVSSSVSSGSSSSHSASSATSSKTNKK